MIAAIAPVQKLDLRRMATCGHWRRVGGLSQAETPMSVTVLEQREADPLERLVAVLPPIAARAAEHDAANTFVAESYALLKRARLFSAGVPAELGGDGLSPPELAALLTRLARSCSATALAFAM